MKAKRQADRWLNKFTGGNKLAASSSKSNYDDDPTAPGYNEEDIDENITTNITTTSGSGRNRRGNNSASNIRNRNFTEEQLHAAKLKLGDVAATYQSKGRGPKVASLSGASMSYAVFKDQLRRNFGLTLSTGEFQALLSQFDKDGDGGIDGGEFMNTFFKLGRAQERKRIAAERRKKKEKKAREQRFADRATAKFRPTPPCAVEWPEKSLRQMRDNQTLRNTGVDPSMWGNDELYSEAQKEEAFASHCAATY